MGPKPVRCDSNRRISQFSHGLVLMDIHLHRLTQCFAPFDAQSRISILVTWSKNTERYGTNLVVVHMNMLQQTDQ